MKNNKAFFSLFFTLFFAVFSTQSQSIWQQLEKVDYSTSSTQLYQKKNKPATYQLYNLNLKAFQQAYQSKSTAKTSIELPNEKGVLRRFTIKETSNFEQKLQEKFPTIKSYSAQGIDDPTATAKISVGTDGFHVAVFSPNHETLYIDPYTKDNKTYIVYSRKSLQAADQDFKCQVEEAAKNDWRFSSRARMVNDGKLRTFRLALVCSAEYAQFHLGANQQNVPASASDAEKKAAVLSAMNTSMTRINGVFERDLAVRMVLVGNNDKIVFLDAATDGITDGSPETMISEVQTICDSNIGNTNYDIGHIFSIGGDGLAGLGVVCIPGQKARGVTGRSQPVGDPFDIDFVAHEMGHQFGATHTQNNDCNRTSSTAIEPGSASTIMGYAGICFPNVQDQSDDYFHAVSIKQMWTTIQTSANCALVTDTNNAPPTANAGPNYVIPVATPFKLEGSATDANGLSSLTYSWEQIDAELGNMPPLSSNTAGPVFRSLPPKNVPVRYFPDLGVITKGTNSLWEVLPSVARELNFSFLVRDNHAGGGGTARDDVKIMVVNSQNFAVTAPNMAVTWDTGTTQTITWQKGATDNAPINCQAVNIKLSLDGGATFPITLKSNTPNDGSESVIVPDNATTSARIMVEAVNNIFFNVNETNFTINSTTPTFIMSANNSSQIACNSGNDTATFTLNFDFINGFSENVSLSASGNPLGSTIRFSQHTINTDGTVNMTISNFNNVAPIDYQLTVFATSSSVNQQINTTFRLLTDSFNELTLSSPTNGAQGISINPELQWNLDDNATSYDVEIATDLAFTNLVSSATVTSNLYAVSSLVGLNTYYWRVKPKNNCGEGNFSAPFSFQTLTPNYCTSTYTDEIGGTEHILNVKFNSINHDSGNDTEDGYQNFTTISTAVKRGETHEVSVTFDTGGFQDQCFVFIDWNQDFIFDVDTEKYDLGQYTNDVETATQDILIPMSAKLGNTRMRVFIEYFGNGYSPGSGACDTDQDSEWGETEDYTLVIQDATASIDDVAFGAFNLYPNPTAGSFTLAFDTANNDAVSIQLFDLRGRLIEKRNYTNIMGRFSKKINFTKLSQGMYLVKIKNGTTQTTRKLIVK